MNKLVRSRTSRKIFGVCGGIGEYFGVDPTIIRVVWIVFACFGGAGILAYFLSAWIIPDALD